MRPISATAQFSLRNYMLTFFAEHLSNKLAKTCDMLPSIAKLSCVSKLISLLQNALLSLIILADNSAKKFRAACPSVTHFIFTANLVKWIRQRIS